MITTWFRSIKNLRGWSSSRKRVAFAVDDYGNVRLHSAEAGKALDAAGVELRNRFDRFDALETREDLQALFDVLDSVKDARGKPAVFTPYALPCNIDFEGIEREKYAGYRYERLTSTYEKLGALLPGAYEGAWDLWQEGMRAGILHPEFHGREHLNLKVFEGLLRRRDPGLMANLANRSYVGIRHEEPLTIKWTAAYSFAELAELERFPEILTTGMDSFEAVFGRRATAFTPPAQQFHPSLHGVLERGGIRAIDRPWVCRQHMGAGAYRRVVSKTGGDGPKGSVTLVRNAHFEPTDDQVGDWVGLTLQQIEAAFRWNKPAIVSSHRVNFSGHIDPANRKTGLAALRRLLREITRRWPDVEFVSVAELVDAIRSERRAEPGKSEAGVSKGMYQRVRVDE